jgi:hypothetical protein
METPPCVTPLPFLRSHFPRDMSSNDTHWLGTDSMERDTIVSHESYTNYMYLPYPTCNPQPHPTLPLPLIGQVRAARRIPDTSWFAVPGGVVQSRDRIEKAGQPGPGPDRQADKYMKWRKRKIKRIKGPDPTTRRRCMGKTAAVVHTRFPPSFHVPYSRSYLLPFLAHAVLRHSHDAGPGFLPPPGH